MNPPQEPDKSGHTEKLDATPSSPKAEPEKKQLRFESIDDKSMLTSTDDVKKKNARFNRLSQKRFGRTIPFDKYKASNIIKILAIIIAIIIIPLEIFLESVLQSTENNAILSFQRALGDSEGLTVFFSIPIYLLSPHVTLAIMIFLYLAADSLIAFKAALLTCFGLYFLTFLKLIYKDGRPFWV